MNFSISTPKTNTEQISSSLLYSPDTQLNKYNTVIKGQKKAIKNSYLLVSQFLNKLKCSRQELKAENTFKKGVNFLNVNSKNLANMKMFHKNNFCKP